MVGEQYHQDSAADLLFGPWTVFSVAVGLAAIGIILWLVVG